MSINRFTAYRNSDEFSNLDMHMRSRTAPLRNRRDLRIGHQSTTTEDNPSTEIAAIESDGQRNRRDAPECVSNYNAERQLLIGCSQPNIIEVRPQCNQEDEGMCTPESFIPLFHSSNPFAFLLTFISVYNCHGTWTENSTTFTVAIHAGSQHGVCITYQPLAGSAARLFVSDSCQRPHMLPTSDHHLLANLTVIGSYELSSSSSSKKLMTFLLESIQQANARTLAQPHSLQLSIGLF